MTTTLVGDATATPPPAPVHTHRRSRGRLVGAAAVAVAGVSLIGTGAFSSWDTTARVDSGAVAAGTVSAALVDANGGQFTTPVSNLLPGDWFYRYVDVQNNGSGPSTFTGSVSVAGGLAGYILVDASTCPTTWNTSASTCSVPATPLTSGTPAVGTPLAVTHGSIAAGAVQHVRYRFLFSASAPISLQGLSTSISATVSNTVVGGIDRTGG